MKYLSALLGGLLLLAPAVPIPMAAQEPQKPAITETNLKVGEMAPDFTLPSDQKDPFTLSQYRGKKTVILAFYVLAFTGG
jgi:cytochrome oxidase Cu insertion factor (SCO1/SenC/PrrC family)